MTRLIPLLLIPILASGCVHSLRITNSKSFAPTGTKPEQPVKVGFAPIGTDRLLLAAIKEVKADAAVADAKEDYKFGSDYPANYVCQLTRDAKFKASGQNFFIAFPGFIVFTHALVGYKYTAEITTQLALFDRSSNVLSRLDIATPYQFRHCSFARGASAGCCGYLLPGYGACAIIPGAIFAASYDKRATSELMEKAEKSYGAYISSRILDQISRAQTNLVATNLSSVSAAPVPVAPAAEDEASQAARETEYAVYLMPVADNVIGEPAVQVKELPDSVRATLNAMSRTGMTPDETALEDMLVSLGLSPEQFFGKLNQAKVLTQIEERIVPLQPRSAAGQPLL